MRAGAAYRAVLRLLPHWNHKHRLLVLHLIVRCRQHRSCFFNRLVAAQRPLRVELLDVKSCGWSLPLVVFLIVPLSLPAASATLASSSGPRRQSPSYRSPLQRPLRIYRSTRPLRIVHLFGSFTLLSPVGPADYFPKSESKYFRFEGKPKFVEII